MCFPLLSWICVVSTNPTGMAKEIPTVKNPIHLLWVSFPPHFLHLPPSLCLSLQSVFSLASPSITRTSPECGKTRLTGLLRVSVLLLAWLTRTQGGDKRQRNDKKKKKHEMKAVILSGFHSMKQGNSYTQILKLFYLRTIVQRNLWLPQLRDSQL